ncbi:MAG: ArnT family glycosyltransferase [Thermoleophilia bacterium]
MAGNDETKKLSPEILWLLAVFFLAIVIRTIAVLTRDMILLDETSYVRMAENLLLGHAPYDITGISTTHYSILYPLVTSAFAVVTRNEVTAGYAVSVLFSSLLILPTYLFGRVMWNIRVGRAATALVAVLPVLVAQGSIIDGANMFAFWLLCALFFGYRMQFTKRCMCGMLSGTCLGIAYLDDPSALYYLLTLFSLLVIVGFRQELSNYANKAAVHFVLLFLVFAIPNVAFMTWQNGSLTVNDRSSDQIYAAVHNLPQGSLDRERDMYSLTPAGDLRLNELRQGDGIFASLAHSPGPFLKSVVRQDYSYYFKNLHYLVPVWLLPLIGLGMFKHAWTRREGLKYGYFALVMAPLLVLPIVWGDPRFALPYLGIVMLWVARGWVYLEEWSTESVGEIAGWQSDDKRHKQQVQVVLAVLVLLPLAALALWNVTRADYPVEYRQAGEWLAENGFIAEKVMSRESATSWYSGNSQLILPYASVAETLDYARKNNARYFVISRRVTDQLRPELEPLMDENNTYRDQLEPVYHTGAGSDAEIIIYQVKTDG